MSIRDDDYDGAQWRVGYTAGLIEAVKWLEQKGNDKDAALLQIDKGLVIDGARRVTFFPIYIAPREYQSIWTVQDKDGKQQSCTIPITQQTKMLGAMREARRLTGFIGATSSLYVDGGKVDDPYNTEFGDLGGDLMSHQLVVKILQTAEEQNNERHWPGSDF